jgi:putative two-component system response regulator
MTVYTPDLINQELLDAIRRMAHLAEYRKPNILSHLERIRGYCEVIASGLGLPLIEVQMIACASQLHDIGEVELPESVSNRNGQLTPYEWELIKRHPVIGADLLRGSGSPVLQMGEQIALSHHERWDGSGYPHGLKEDEIPLGGRICALADVFDALTTRRPYKAELPVESALLLVQETSGQFFEPQLVDVFSDHFVEILDIRKMNI